MRKQNAIGRTMTFIAMVVGLQATGPLNVRPAGAGEAAPPGRGQAAGTLPPSAGEVDELRRKVEVLAEEIESLKTRMAVPERAEYKSAYGLGPAASKVYGIERGLSIGGYGEANLRLFITDKGTNKNQVDFLRFVTYFGYKLTDRIILNSEIEFEHAKTGSTVTTGGGEVSVEFAYLDFLLHDRANARTGLLLAPVGLINELHEPVFFFGNIRPEVEQRIIPTTWRELGVGLHGTLAPGLTYRTYVMNSLNAKGFSKTNIRNARQNGNRAFIEDPAWTARLDYSPDDRVLLGSSFFWGNTGQDQSFGGRQADVNFLLYDLHGQFRYRGWQLRGLFAQGHIGNADVLSADSSISGPISKRIWGAYGEVAYDLLTLLAPGSRQSLSPFLRFERVNTQADVPAGFTADRSRDFKLYTLGVSYKPIPNVVLKLDYRNFDPRSGSIADEINLGFGFIF